jgi:CRISPR/Cas system CSM-associated protein Csm3 (group 7 of RAMP superfamily)
MADLLRIHLQAELTSALHILGPGRTGGLLDRPIELDAQGYPLIPASTMRGRLRTHLERLLASLGQLVCTPPSPERMCPHAWHTTGPPGGFCMACRIFGSPWYEAGIVSEDLRLDINQRIAPGLLRTDRTSVGISRILLTAQAERLFSIETTSQALGREPLRFTGALNGRLERLEAGYLLAATRLVVHAGGSKARGLGALKLQITNVAWWRERAWVAEKAHDVIEEALKHAQI